jgi:hypothetical protein
MPDAKATSPEQVKATLDRVIFLSKILVKLTPTDVDNKVVDVFEKLFAEAWFVELVAYAIDAFDGDDATAAARRVVEGLKGKVFASATGLGVTA